LQHDFTTTDPLDREIIGHAQQSMSRKSNCRHNAVIESFFGCLPDELYRTTFLSTGTPITTVDVYIDRFNTERAHATRKGLNPVRYRAQALAA